MPRPLEADVVIIGAGLVGTALTLLLDDTALRVVQVEANPEPVTTDPRPFALALSSLKLLRQCGVWQRLEPISTPVQAIDVLQAGLFGCLKLRASDYGWDEFARVVAAGELSAAIAAEQERCRRLTLLRPGRLTKVDRGPGQLAATVATANETQVVNAKLMVVAAGRDGLADILGTAGESRDYGQTAVVCPVLARSEFGNTAIERFAPGGPSALLPAGGGPAGQQRFGTVLVRPCADAEALAALTENQYARRLEQVFGGRIQAVELAAPRRTWPLRGYRMHSLVGERMVFAGAAALAVHPNGAQGFNLGLRDAAVLAQLLASHADRDVGAGSVLAEYAAARATDHARAERITDGLARWFMPSSAPRRLLSALGLNGLSLFPGVEHGMVQRMTGLTSLRETGLGGAHGGSTVRA